MVFILQIGDHFFLNWVGGKNRQKVSQIIELSMTSFACCSPCLLFYRYEITYLPTAINNGLETVKKRNGLFRIRRHPGELHSLLNKLQYSISELIEGRSVGRMIVIKNESILSLIRDTQ